MFSSIREFMLPKVRVYSLQMKIDTDRWLVYLIGT